LTGVRLHLKAPLYRNAYFLMLGAGSGSLLGFAFWTVAARHYPPRAVGVASAVIATMTVVSGVSQLGLGTVLFRYLPGAGRATRSLILKSYAITMSLSVVASVAVAISTRWWAPSVAFLGRDSRWLVAFVAATTAWTVFTLQDSVLTALRQAKWIPLEDTFFSATKIALLFTFAGGSSAGIFLAWNIPVLVSLVPINLLIFDRFIAQHVENTAARVFSTPRNLVRFAGGNYLGGVFFLASTTLLPVLVAAEAGATAAAYFYIPWTIAAALQNIPLNMATSLTVEAALDESQLREYVRSVTVQTLRLSLPVVVLVIVGARYVLEIFGHAYAIHGETLLQLLAAASIPNVLVALGTSVVRIQNDARMVLLIPAVVGVITLALSAALVTTVGIAGVGIAWLTAQLVVATWIALKILQPLFLRAAEA
jgi:O-antigen/teichoic acid export membrane protein